MILANTILDSMRPIEKGVAKSATMNDAPIGMRTLAELQDHCRKLRADAECCDGVATGTRGACEGCLSRYREKHDGENPIDCELPQHLIDRLSGGTA